MTTIIIKNGNMCQLDGPQRVLIQLFGEYKIKHPNAWHIQKFQRGKYQWDGTIKYISQTGSFKIGLLPKVYESLERLGEKVKIEDRRLPLKASVEIPRVVGKYTLYPRQQETLRRLLNYKVGGIPFHICSGDISVGYGKCIGGESLVHTSKGVFRIDELINKKGKLAYSGLKILAQDGKYHPIVASTFNRIKAIKITTTQGYTQVCGYDNHRYYTVTPEGKLDWRYAHDLKEGDYLPIMRSSNISTKRYDLDRAYLIGALQGDGSMKVMGPNQIRVCISGIDIEIMEAVKQGLDFLCKTPVKIKPHRKFEGYHIEKSDLWLTHWLQREVPELIGSSHTKKVPKVILDAAPEVQWSYLAGLFDTDGSKPSGHIEYSFSSVCEENIHRLQYMLLHLGIISFVSPKKTLCNGKRGIAYRLRVGSREFEEFGRNIPLKVPRKKFNEEEYISLFRDTLFYQLPIQVGKICKELYKNNSFNTRNNPIPTLAQKQLREPKRLTLYSLEQVCKHLNPPQHIHDFYKFSQKVYWDKIKSIEIIPEYDCYDLEVQDIHEYLADGFICHNTGVMCSIHQCFQGKLKTLVLLNDSDLFNQFKREIPEWLPYEDIAFIQGSKVTRWGNFNVAMVQSLSRNLKKYQQNLLDIDIVLLDECDVIDNRTYKSVIERLYNARIRIGMSGTLYMSKLKKDLVHNMNIMSFIGPVVDTVKLKDQMKAGKATPVVVKMVPVQDFGTAVRGDYAQEYQDTITDNEQAYEASWERALYNARYHRLPMLIVTKFINHCESLYKFYCKRNSLLNHRFKIAYVHHETKERKQILEDFRNGKIDILISTTIISRGKNFPSLKYLQNTASMDSNEKAIQILGRLVRQHESKTKAYLDDLMFQGNYLTRHGRHRKVYYQKERLKVIILKNSYPLPNV